MARPMIGSAIAYAGLIVAFVGLLLFAKPVERMGVPTRAKAVVVVVVGVVLLGIGLLLPAPESRVSRVTSHLDEVIPAWQFGEHHSIRIDAPPARVYHAMRAVRADEIALFSTLTWLRRCGRKLPENILNAGTDPLIDVALRSGFVQLADAAPTEFVMGTVVHAPDGLTANPRTEATFRTPLPPGFAIAAMNFLIGPDGAGGSLVSTDTRVFASSPAATRRFAAYWRMIYPGSAIIRMMWLRAIKRRAMASS